MKRRNVERLIAEAEARRRDVERMVDRSEQRLVDRMDRENQASRTAVVTALSSIDERLRGMNEFRGTVQDQQRLFMPRIEAEKSEASMQARAASLESARTETQSKGIGQAALLAYMAIAVAIVGGLIAMVMQFLKH